MKIENAPIRPPFQKPLFDAPVYPGEEGLSQEQRCIPSPSDTLFATPEGKAITFGPDAYARYILSPEKDKKPLMHSLATELIAHPSYINSFFSFGSDHYDESTKSLTPELIHTLPEIIKKSDSLSERQARELLTLATSNDKKRQLFAQHVLREYVNATMHIDTEKKDVDLNNATKTQYEIVELLHSLTLAGLEIKDVNIYKFLYDVFTLKTPILALDDPQTGLFAIAGQSGSDETLAKGLLLDQTVSLFGQLLGANQNEYTDILVLAAEKSKKYTKPFLSRDLSNKKRDAQLMDFYTNRNRELGTYLEEENVDLNEFNTRPLPFPENIVYIQSQKMWPLFLDLFSEVMVKKGVIKSPIAQFSLPDGSLRFIAEDSGNSENVARGIISYALNETHFPPEVYGKKVIESFLRFTTPEILEQNMPDMKRMLAEKKQALNLPVRGINQSGVEIQYGENHHIAATSLSIDQSGRAISLKMGNYSIHLQLNKLHELVDTDGHPLDLPENARVWWETVVLAPLKELVCPTREDGVLITGTEDLSPAEALLKTKKVLLTRIGFLRRLPIGKCFTPEQASKTLEVLYPLPGIEKLDLAELNKSLGYTKDEGQYTYVLPLEKEKKDALPLSIHTPHAFDDVAKYMQ